MVSQLSIERSVNPYLLLAFIAKYVVVGSLASVLVGERVKKQILISMDRIFMLKPSMDADSSQIKNGSKTVHMTLAKASAYFIRSALGSKDSSRSDGSCSCTKANVLNIAYIPQL